MGVQKRERYQQAGLGEKDFSRRLHLNLAVGPGKSIARKDGFLWEVFRTVTSLASEGLQHIRLHK